MLICTNRYENILNILNILKNVNVYKLIYENILNLPFQIDTFTIPYPKVKKAE